MCANCCCVSGCYWFWTRSCTAPRSKRGGEVVWLLSQALAAITDRLIGVKVFPLLGSLLERLELLEAAKQVLGKKNLVCLQDEWRRDYGHTCCPYPTPATYSHQDVHTSTEPLLLLCVCFCGCNKWWDQLHQHGNWLQALPTAKIIDDLHLSEAAQDLG